MVVIKAEKSSPGTVVFDCDRFVESRELGVPLELRNRERCALHAKHNDDIIISALAKQC